MLAWRAKVGWNAVMAERYGKHKTRINSEHIERSQTGFPPPGLLTGYEDRLADMASSTKLEFAIGLAEIM
jgi:hypothetical protein